MKRGFAELVLLLTVLAVGYSLRPVPWWEKTVVLEEGLSRVEALESVGEQLGLEVVLASELHELGEIDGGEFFAEDAIDELASGAYWKIFDKCLIVCDCGPERIPYCGGIRMEFLLDEYPSEFTVNLLKENFLAVRFTPHPTMNGFYASGSKDDLLEIKHILDSIDRPEGPKGIELQRSYQLRHLEPQLVEPDLIRVFPSVQITTNPHGMIQLSGPGLEAVRARSWLALRDRVEISRIVNVAELKAAPKTCVLKPYRHSRHTVDCHSGCEGPLHRLGLKPGDLLPDYRNKPLQNTNPIWVHRGDQRLLITLQSN